MKKEEEKENSKNGFQKDNWKSSDKNDDNELKTDFPLSEKDEVKQAEEKARKRVKK